MSFLFSKAGVAGLIGASSVIGAKGARDEGKAIEAVNEYNAKIADNQAEVERDEGAEQARRMRIENEAILGNQLARRAAATLDIQSGSALLTSAKTASRLELEIFENNRARNNRAMQERSRAAMLRFQGKQAKTASKLKAGTQLLGGAGKIAQLFI